MTTTITTNKPNIWSVLNNLYDPEHHWLLNAEAKFTVHVSNIVQFDCKSDYPYSVDNRNPTEITFEDDNVALQFKLTYGDLL